MANLNYVITLTGMVAPQYQEVQKSIAELQAFVRQGAEFPITVDSNFSQKLKRQIQDALRDGLQLHNTDSSGGAAANGDLLDRIKYLSIAIETLTTQIRKLAPENPPPPPRPPAEAQAAVDQRAAAQAALARVTEKFYPDPDPSMATVRRRHSATTEDATRDAANKEFRKLIAEFGGVGEVRRDLKKLKRELEAGTRTAEESISAMVQVLSAQAHMPGPSGDRSAGRVRAEPPGQAVRNVAEGTGFGMTAEGVEKFARLLGAQIGQVLTGYLDKRPNASTSTMQGGSGRVRKKPVTVSEYDDHMREVLRTDEGPQHTRPANFGSVGEIVEPPVVKVKTQTRNKQNKIVERTSDAYNVTRSNQLPAVEQLLAAQDIVGLDFETDPKTQQVRTMQISLRNAVAGVESILIDLKKFREKPAQIARVFRALADDRLMKVGHNLSFEERRFQELSGMSLGSNLYDTQLVDRAIQTLGQKPDETGRYRPKGRGNLSEVANRYLGITLGGKGTVQTSFDMHSALTEEQINYALADALHALELYEHLQKTAKAVNDPSVREKLQSYIQGHGKVVQHIAANLSEGDKAGFFDTLDEVVARSVHRGEDMSGILARLTGKAPGLSVSGQANLRDVVNTNMQSSQSMAYMRGLRWYGDQEVATQNAASLLGAQRFMAVPGMSSNETLDAMQALIANPPAALFTHAQKSDNPVQARAQFVQAVKEDAERLGRFLQDPRNAAGVMQGGVGGFSYTAGRAILQMADKVRELEQNPMRTTEEGQALTDLTEALQAIKISSAFGGTAESISENMRGPLHFASIENPRRVPSMLFTGPFERNDGYGLSPVVLERMRQGVGGAYTPEEMKELEQQQETWAQANGLTFFRQESNRQAALARYMTVQGNLLQSLRNGVLPDAMVSMLGRVAEIRPDFVEHDEVLLADYERRMAAGEISPTSVSKKINPAAYGDVIKALETRLDFAYAEQMQGGLWGLPTNPFLQRRGAIIPGKGAMLLTSQQYDNGKLLVDPSTLSFGSVMPDMSPELLSVFRTGATTGIAPGTLTAEQMQTLHTLQQHADVTRRLRPHNADPSLMVDPVTGETFKRASALGGTMSGSAPVSLAVGTGLDTFVRDVLGGTTKEFSAYQTQLNGQQFPLFANEQLFKEHLEALNVWKQTMTADGSVLLTDDMRFSKPAGPGEEHGLSGSMDIKRVRPDGTVDVFDVKSGTFWQSAAGEKKYTEQLVGGYKPLLEHMGLRVGELALLPFLTRFMGDNKTGTPTLIESQLMAMKSLGFGAGGTMANPVLGSGGPGGGGIGRVPAYNVAPGDALRVFVVNFSELKGAQAVVAAATAVTPAVAPVTPTASTSGLTGVAATRDLADQLQAQRRVSTAQQLADIDLQKRRRILELNREFSSLPDTELDRLLAKSAAEVIQQDDPTLLPFTRGVPAENYKKDKVLFGRDTKKMLSSLMSADNARSTAEARLMLHAGDPAELLQLYDKYLRAENKTDIAHLATIEMLRQGDLTRVGEAINEENVPERLDIAAKQGLLGIRGSSALRYLQELKAATMTVQEDQNSKTARLGMAQGLYDDLANTQMIEEQTKRSGAYDVAIQREKGAEAKLQQMQERLKLMSNDPETITRVRDALMNANVIDPVTGQYVPAGSSRTMTTGNFHNALRAALPHLSNEELSLFAGKLLPSDNASPKDGKNTLFPNLRTAELTEEQRQQIAAYDAQLPMNFGAPEFKIENAENFLRAILTHRQAKAAEAEAELADKTQTRQTAETAASGVTGKQLREKFKLAQDDLFAVLNVKNMKEAEASIGRLKRELQKSADTMGALSQRSKDTLEQMAALFEQPIDNAEQLAEVLDQVLTAFRASGTLTTRVAGQVVGDGRPSTQPRNMLGGIFDKVQSLWNYAAAGTVVYGFVNTLKQTASSLVTFEAELKRIQGVLDTRASAAAAQIGAGITQNALDYGVNVQESIRAAKTFAQIGANPQDVVSLSRAALVGQVGAGLEPQQATELLIAARNVTNERVQPMDILDRISNIEARYAVSAQDLSEGVMRVGSLATQLQPGTMGGVDALDTVIGAVTTIVERTRISGNQAATALRFMVSRLSAPDVSRDLQERFGIRLAGDTPNQLRPLQDILAEIAEKYQGLLKTNSVQASELLTTFAGARQANVGAALLGNFDRAMQISAESSRSFGDAQDRATLQLDTAQAKVSQLNTSFFTLLERLNEQTGALEIFKFAVTGAAELLQSLTPKTGNSLGTTLLGVGGVSAAGYGTARALSSLFGGLIPGEAGTKIGAGLMTTARAFPVIGGSLAVLAAGRYALNYAYDNELFGLRSYRGSYDVSQEAREDMETRKTAAAKLLGISGEQLTVGMRQAFERTVDIFGQDRVASMLQLLKDKDPNTQLPGEARELEKEFTKQVRAIFPQFAELGGQAEQLTTALSNLRLAVQELDMPTSAYARSLNQSREEFTKLLDEQFQGRLASVNGRVVLPTRAGILPDGSLGIRTVIPDPREILNSLFKVQGANLLPNLGNMGFYTKDGLERIDMVDLAKRLQAQAQAQGSQISLVTALSRAAEQLFGMRNSVKQEFDRAVLDGGASNLGSVVGLINRNFATGGLGERRPPVSKEDIYGITNALRVVTRAEEVFSARTASARRATTMGADETSGMERLYELVQLGMKRAIARASAENRDPLVKQYEEVTNLLQSPRARTAMMANIQDVSGDMVSIKARFMTPYFNLMARQAEYASGMALRDQGFEFDPVVSREAMMRGFAEDMQRVRPEMLRENLTAQLQLGQKVRSGLDFEEILSTVGDSGRTSADIAATLREMLPQNQPGISRDELTRQRARVMMQKEYIDKLSSNYASVFETSPELQAQFGSVQEQLQNMLRMLDDGSLETSGEAANQFRLSAIMMARTLDEATTSAVRFAGAQRTVTLNRERDRIILEKRLLDTQFSLERQGAESRRRGAFSSADSVRMGRPSDAVQAQLQLLLEEGERAVQLRDAQLNTIREKELLTGKYGDMNNPSVRRAFENEVARQSMPVLDASRRQLAQLGDQGAALYDQERNRVRDAEEQQFQELLRGSTQGLREVLMDFNKLKDKPLEVIIPAIAQTFQGRLVDSFMDSMFGPMGVFTDRLRQAHEEGGLSVASRIYSAHLEGIAAGVRVLQGRAPGATPAEIAGAGAVGQATFSSSVGSMLPNVTLPGMQEGSLYDADTKTWKVVATRSRLNVPPITTVNPNLIAGANAVRDRITMENMQDQPAKPDWSQVTKMALSMAGQMGGAYLGSQTGVRGGKNYAQEGSSIGAMLGMAVPGLGPFGGLIGGALGGFIGGRFGKDRDSEQQYAALEKIERNTRQQVEVLESQTAMMRLDSRFLNVAAGFTVPTYRPFGATAAAPNVQINVYAAEGQNESVIAEQVATALRRELSGRGSGFDVRMM